MTRQWLGVDPRDLCEQHLLGEHAEHHQEVGTLRSHPHGEAVVRGHVEAGQVVLQRIQRRHDKLAAELERRGNAHDSPMEFDADEAPTELADVDEHSVELNRDALVARCDGCRARMRVCGGASA